MTVFVMLSAAALLIGMTLFAIQSNSLQAATVDPFTSPVSRDASADTAAGDAMTRTAPPASRQQGTEWNVRTLTDLSEVEDFLDYLESRGVSDREVNTIGEEGFAIRWR